MVHSNSLSGKYFERQLKSPQPTDSHLRAWGLSPTGLSFFWIVAWHLVATGLAGTMWRTWTTDRDVWGHQRPCPSPPICLRLFWSISKMKTLWCGDVFAMGGSHGPTIPIIEKGSSGSSGDSHTYVFVGKSEGFSFVGSRITTENEDGIWEG